MSSNKSNRDRLERIIYHYNQPISIPTNIEDGSIWRNYPNVTVSLRQLKARIPIRFLGIIKPCKQLLICVTVYFPEYLKLGSSNNAHVISEDCSHNGTAPQVYHGFRGGSMWLLSWFPLAWFDSVCWFMKKHYDPQNYWIYRSIAHIFFRKGEKRKLKIFFRYEALSKHRFREHAGSAFRLGLKRPLLWSTELRELFAPAGNYLTYYKYIRGFGWVTTKGLSLEAILLDSSSLCLFDFRLTSSQH